VIARLGANAMAAWETHAQVPGGWLVDPQKIIQCWCDFATRLTQEHAGKTVLVVTSNGIARFSPYLTGDFEAFCKTHGIKLSTGALGLFEHQASSSVWRCNYWNVKP
jgi:probable phosphoglycerate mutase